ncbi:glycosyltransferase family 4 protein [Bosea sp. 117]|uniref:glycosyltransferase family 4 protein n=1 Tax=Bosea sp. 117 TaxID=1125973 RepID=UPI0009DFA3B8|nr:glycosyltransferase family 4 protein [Bosea sp. 117]
MAGVVVSQLGARMHYAVPRILAERGELAHFYTDICATQGWPRLIARLPPRLLPRAVRRLAARRPEGVPAERVTSFPGFGLDSALRRLAGRSREAETRNALWAGQRFSELVAGRGFHGASGVYAFAGDALEMLAAARAQGLWTAVEQMIAPRDMVERLLREESERFPEWQPPQRPDRLAPFFAARERAEWALADRVICPSAFVMRAVIDSGVAPARCALVPYGVDGRFAVPRPGERRPGPLRVLTVGAVGLRKGSPYVIEAAHRLAGRAAFRMVGPCGVPPAVAAQLARFVELTGPIPRSEMRDQFAWADVFLLPSLCEGSATAVYEAMSAGLPVICTGNTGSVVRDGLDGFIVPIRDADAIVAALERFAAEPELMAQMSRNAASRSADYTLERYGDRLMEALSPLLLAAGRSSLRHDPAPAATRVPAEPSP